MDKLEIFNDLEQGSDAWFQARCGLVTMSCLKDVMAKGDGKMRTKYLRTLAAEIHRGAPSPRERFSNAHMNRGHQEEDDALDKLAFLHDVDIERVGFMRRGRVGYSPDGLIGTDGLVEVKTKADDLHLEYIEAGKLPAEHVKQCQGGLWVSGRQYLLFVSYSPGLPLFVRRVERDDAYIARIKVEVDDFIKDLDAMVEKIRNYEVAA